MKFRIVLSDIAKVKIDAIGIAYSEYVYTFEFLV